MFSLGKSALLPVAAVLMAAALSAQTTQYDFQIVARTGGSIGGNTIVNFSEPALLNDNGDVVFSAAHSGGQGIFTPTQPLVKTGDTIDGKQLSSVSSPALNASGNLRFLGGFAGGSAIFSQTNALVKTGDTIDGQPIFNFYRGLSLNGNGELAFQASTGTSFPTGTAVFVTCPDGNSKLLISPGHSVEGKTLSAIGTPVINDQGIIAFRGEFVNLNNPDDTGVLTIDSTMDSTPTLVAQTGSTADGRTLTVFGFPSGVTQDGGVVTRANFEGGSGVFSLAPPTPEGNGGSHLLVQAGDTIGGQVLTQVGLVSVNRNGKAAFYGTFAGGSGIFTPTDLIVKTGDQVGLNTITAILFNSTAYNANGAVAFTAVLDDGSRAVIVGQPVNSGNTVTQSVIRQNYSAFTQPLFSIAVRISEGLFPSLVSFAANRASFWQTPQ